MDGAGRLKGRPGMSKQDVCEWKAKPSAPEMEGEAAFYFRKTTALTLYSKEIQG